jgi:hypothetical protein
MEYVLKEFKSNADLLNGDLYQLSSYHWEADIPYRPLTYANVGIVGDSLVAVLKCYEDDPKADCLNRDDPIYTDSCLEFFVAPVSEKDEYINIECNSKGVFLSEFGAGKYGRRLVSDLTPLSPSVDSFSGKDDNGAYWGIFVEITKQFVYSVYKINIDCIDFSKVKLNFYKCGDGCQIPHYLAFSPVTTLPPGFHNPDCFATFKKEI